MNEHRAAHPGTAKVHTETRTAAHRLRKDREFEACVDQVDPAPFLKVHPAARGTLSFFGHAWTKKQTFMRPGTAKLTATTGDCACLDLHALKQLNRCSWLGSSAPLSSCAPTFVFQACNILRVFGVQSVQSTCNKVQDHSGIPTLKRPGLLQLLCQSQ
eukprot:scaffold105947_cov20-Tisochrysis_lutea.AAC.1